MDEITIHVMQEDIDQGNPNYSNSCAIAKAALRDLFLEEGTIHVSHTYLSVFSKNERGLIEGTTCYDLPWEATQFITRFDEGEAVEPIKFIATKTKEWETRIDE
jgi:hypothetical protein